MEVNRCILVNNYLIAILRKVLHLILLQYNMYWGFPGGSAIKNLPAVWETPVLFLGWEDLLEKGNTTHSSILA